MKPRLAIILTLLVVLPTALLMGLSLRLAHHEQSLTQKRFHELLLERLGDVDEDIARLLWERENDLGELLITWDVSHAEPDRSMYGSPLVRQFFLLGPEGELIYPQPGNHLSATEWGFLERAQDLLERKALLQHTATERIDPPDSLAGHRKSLSISALDNSANLRAQRPTPLEGRHGWYAWYWGRGIRLIYWLSDEEGIIRGAEVNLVRILSEIIAILPDTGVDDDPGFGSLLAGRLRLLDSRGEVLYQWGSYEAPDDEPSAARRALGSPLDAWTLDLLLPPDQLTIRGRGTLLAILASITGIGLVLGGLAVYFYRESSRELRTASRRVTFVNQVSHELKTPLTNIRLYAELLSERFADADSKTTQHIGVIVSESQRLSRLIGNILNFGRKQKDKLTLHPTVGIPDDAIQRILDCYRPGLEACGVFITFEPDARKIVSFDNDALEQILGNLLSNIEKYAASGGQARIESHQTEGKTIIIVSDAGPGVSIQNAEQIFEPFVRISNNLTDGVSGTGIGLSIARDLARLHGGDLELVSTEFGATFRLILQTLDDNA